MIWYDIYIYIYMYIYIHIYIYTCDMWLMILRLEMILSVVPYQRKNIIFNEKNLKVTKNNILNNGFCDKISS